MGRRGDEVGLAARDWPPLRIEAPKINWQSFGKLDQRRLASIGR